ncbi:hypothetical protein HBH98_176080 [Parastagonospora nodorum]|nr:hypothetical protein HBH53_045310 [Parastagonospora nodorum]KAH4108129.1 hypothetical protein HBH46_044760 [Parastagonospora nodorum]KAH4180389.1 hypothetical protein HBH43_003390 [Parastagonospora nodorum]KAH4209138.1 hypothetical protein HBI95_085960 [Parastagonospora nodorum]KAH4341767.1 hypothetical protein HBH98_176080 [Parastagonospora nodorum]
MAKLRGPGPWYESFHILLIGCFSLPLRCWLLHSKQSATNSNVGHRIGRTALWRITATGMFEVLFQSRDMPPNAFYEDMEQTIFRDNPCFTPAKDDSFPVRRSSSTTPEYS